jgi:glucose/arabinose dehydrogenase
MTNGDEHTFILLNLEQKFVPHAKQFSSFRDSGQAPSRLRPLTNGSRNGDLVMLSKGVGCVLVLVWAFASVRAAGALRSELVVSGFVKPLFAVAPPGDTNRLFVLEQHSGNIKIVDLATGSVKPTPFLVVSNILKGSEQGLLGLAFHPDYATNGLFYINHVAPGGGTGGHTEVNRYRVEGDPASSDRANATSKTLVLSFNQPEANHNGGWLGFGKDGYLYISTGDGGGANDVHGSPGNGQSRNTFLGKILRIDVDQGERYGIPESNPYRGSLSMTNEVWAFGLRNPWRCSFDRETGDLWIGDVGQDTREEVDVIPAGVGGLNFGWRPREGSIQNAVYPRETPVTAAIEPVYDYTHGSGRSITGGYVYRGSKIAELRGKYVFADYSSARFWEITPSGTNGMTREITAELNPNPKQINSVSSFGEDASGEIYICDYTDGQIFRIASSNVAITVQATQSANGDLQISFNASASQSYALESIEALGTASAAWTVVTNVPAGNSRLVQLTQPVTGAQRYFRLRTP